MAIAGMEQFRWYIASHGIRQPRIAPREVTVLLPIALGGPAHFPFQMSHPIIAAWVARKPLWISSS